MPRKYHLTVVGAGYVGLATAIGLASRGHSIDLVEVRSDRLGALQAGQLPIHEPGMDAAFANLEIRGRIRPGALIPDEPSDAVLICVGTPMDENGRSDLRQLQGALEAARPHIRAGVPLVIRSTLPAGSSESIVRWSGGDSSRLFTNPEFLAQGRALEDFLAPSRVVIGTFPGPDAQALSVVEDLLGSDTCPVMVVSVIEADLIKNGSNAYLALKLSYANELAVLCEELGADVITVIDGIGLDPRLGRGYMRPSFGFGRTCGRSPTWVVTWAWKCTSRRPRRMPTMRTSGGSRAASWRPWNPARGAWPCSASPSRPEPTTCDRRRLCAWRNCCWGGGSRSSAMTRTQARTLPPPCPGCEWSPRRPKPSRAAAWR